MHVYICSCRKYRIPFTLCGHNRFANVGKVWVYTNILLARVWLQWKHSLFILLYPTVGNYPKWFVWKFLWDYISPHLYQRVLKMSLVSIAIYWVSANMSFVLEIYMINWLECMCSKSSLFNFLFLLYRKRHKPLMLDMQTYPTKCLEKL